MVDFGMLTNPVLILDWVDACKFIFLCTFAIEELNSVLELLGVIFCMSLQVKVEPLLDH